MDPTPQDQYDDMWRQARAALAAGAPSLDVNLLDKAKDRRRSATLLIRPCAAVARRVAETLAELQRMEPHQYYYAPAELHVTVLSLFTGTPQPEPLLAQLPTYRAAVAPVLAATPRFHLRFDGLTASPAAVLVQGHMENEGLADLREGLRAAIHAVGLGHHLDGRYRIVTAHMTAVRFCRPLRDPARFAAALEDLRRCEFGLSDVDAVHLVENDWYMSQDKVTTLQVYPLR